MGGENPFTEGMKIFSNAYYHSKQHKKLGQFSYIPYWKDRSIFYIPYRKGLETLVSIPFVKKCPLQTFS